jgi:hypothetical protein
VRIRLTAALGLAAVLLSLTACRNSPKVAAYVGDTAITEARVTQVTDQFNTAIREINASRPEQQPISEVSREIALSVLLRDELCTRLSKQKGFTFTPAPSRKDATELEVLAGHGNACVNAMPGPEQAPTDQQYRAFYDHLVAQGRVAPGRFDEVKQQIKSDPNLMAALGKEELLGHVAEVTLNPRYRQVSLLGFNPLDADPLTVVVNRPPTAAPQ